MDSVDSKENNREQNATENNDGGSVADESSPPCQSRRDAGFKKLKRMSKLDDSGNDGDDESVGCGNSGSCNSKARVLIKDDFENVGDDDDDGSDQDCTSSARDTTLRHVGGDEDANLSWRVVEEKEGHNVEEDPLMESVHSLKVSQEALQQEIEKIKEIGNESVSPDDDDDDSTKCRSEAAEANAVDLEFQDSCSSGHSVKQILLSSMELHVACLTEKINILENKLEELQDELALKDCMILELELALTSDEFPKEESTCTIRSLDEKFKMLESLFEQKIEAEIKYLTIKTEMQNLEVASALAEKQETMSGSEVQNPNKLEVAGNEDSTMKNRTDESGKNRGEILGVEETFMIQGRLCNLTYCLFLQFILLILVLWLIVSKFESNSEGPVPT